MEGDARGTEKTGHLPKLHWLLWGGGLVTKWVLDSSGPWTVARQACPVSGFPKQGYWGWVAISFSEVLPTQAWNPGLLPVQADSLPSSHLRSASQGELG